MRTGTGRGVGRGRWREETGGEGVAGSGDVDGVVEVEVCEAGVVCALLSPQAWAGFEVVKVRMAGWRVRREVLARRALCAIRRVVGREAMVARLLPGVVASGDTRGLTRFGCGALQEC